MGISEGNSRPEAASRRGSQCRLVYRQATHIFSNSPEAPKLGCKILMHPPYSPYLNWFLPMKHNFADEKFASRKAHENRVPECFSNTTEGFYERGIVELPTK